MMMTKIKLQIKTAFMLAMIIFATLMAGTGTSFAAAGPWQGGDSFRARLITALDAIPTNGSDQAIEITAGLEVELQDGWKIYWRSPGDAGLPPELDFARSPQVQSHALSFPAPKRFSILGFDSFGYADHVIYPLSLTVNPASNEVTMVGELSGLVCSDLCIPINEILTLSLGVSDAPSVSKQARGIAQFAALVPRIGTAQGHAIETASINSTGLNIRFTKDGIITPFDGGDIMVETASGYSFAKPVIDGDWVRLTSQGKDAKDLIGEAATLTVVTKDWLLEEQTTLTKAVGVSTPSTAVLSMMLIAFLGGLILNVMPCVLPVLSLKLASVISMGGAEKRYIRTSFLVTALGVITSFLLLGAGIALFRYAGVAVGWGMQFQSPIFLVTAAIAIAGFAVVMMDWVVLPIPQFLSSSSGSRQKGLYGDFLSGFMATLLATPCSAPFVGTALTFAFTTSIPLMMLIFLAMGVGLAAPWIMVAGFPKLAQHLPRPGRWLMGFKRVLAAGLLITSLWLVSIIIAPYIGEKTSQEGWQAWQPQLAQELAADGRVVFVDVTADWCITCKANKALVLDRGATKDAFNTQDIILLRADWTSPDQAISDYLAANDRFGIPFNIVYGPEALEGIALPELLTHDAVASALAQASGQ